MTALTISRPVSQGEGDAGRDQRVVDVEPACRALVDAVTARDATAVQSAATGLDLAAAVVALAEMVRIAEGRQARGQRDVPKPRRLSDVEAQALRAHGAALAYTAADGWHLLGAHEVPDVMAGVL